ncbi:MAG: hypothetical protein F6K40_20255 [Okeania sp. SIO3I5]|uniref:GTPase n=1 Tax=Okeania sp. SIO3I5 TaxID=2607805 RepID=UPI0013B7A115|nr:GTPase [Okeania sp. SIO3I5]NEQ38473.1 hypothetical protein [Okeania sp. SIO3I5]
MNKIPKSELIKIAVTGHTNTGKTTMIQTLMKQEIGEIDDRANVTKDVQFAPYEYEGLQAVFIDTPGFQQANTLLLIKKGKIELDSELEEELEYEIKTWKAIESSDVILYVVSLETVPDISHRKEIELILSTKKEAVALFNKSISLFQVATESDVIARPTTRIEQWEKVLRDSGVSKSFVFDAHWYDPERVVDIYNAIKECLPNDKSLLFEKGLLAFKQHQQYRVRKACNLIFECLDKCRQIITVQASEFDYNLDKSKEKAILGISTLIHGAVLEFIIDASKLYYDLVVPSNAGDAVIKNPEPNIKTKTNIRELLISTTSTTSGLAALGATFGAAIGASTSAVLAGGVGIISGTWIGTQVGSVIGTCLGGIWGIVDSPQDINVQISREAFSRIQYLCITIIWALSQHGYGAGKKLDESVMARRYDIAQKVCTATNFDWFSANEEQIIDQCAKNLSELNQIPLAHIANTEPDTNVQNPPADNLEKEEV